MLDSTQSESRKHFCQIIDLYLPNLEKVKVVFDELWTILCVEDIENEVDVPENSVLDFPDEFMHDLYGVNGAPISPFVKDKLRERCSWCPLRHVAYALPLDDYNAIVHARNAYAVQLSNWDGAVTVQVPKAKFALKLYDDFAVSTRNLTDYGLAISSRIYLGLQHIMKYWSLDVLTRVLNIKVTQGDGGKKWKQYDGWTGDASSQAVSFSLGSRVKDHMCSVEKNMRSSRYDDAFIKRTLAEMCYVMVPRNDPNLPTVWNEVVHPKVPNVTFYPYSTLKAIGLPEVTELEDAISDGICGLEQ